MKYSQHVEMTDVRGHAADLKLLDATVYAPFQRVFAYQGMLEILEEIVFYQKHVVSIIKNIY